MAQRPNPLHGMKKNKNNNEKICEDRDAKNKWQMCNGKGITIQFLNK